MLTEFKGLTDEEQQVMLDAIPHITILVAAADDDLDEVELAQAKRLADIRSFTTTGHLNAYYEKIESGLTDRIMELYNVMPAGLEKREEMLWEELSKLNLILAKMKSPFGYLYYKSFLSFAKHVAESHGGLLRFITVGPKESRVVNLPMVMEVPKPPEDDMDLI